MVLVRRLLLLFTAALLLAAVGVAQAGPKDRQRVDPAAAARGQHLFATACVDCHGAQGRGTAKGADLMVSDVLLHDTNGSTLAPFLKKGHPVESGPPSTSFTAEQITDLSNFLHQEFYATLGRQPGNPPPNIVVGNAARGEAFFNGAGKCAGCHATEAGQSSPATDLAGIATRYTPYDLQQRFIFPNGFHRGAPPPPPVTVTITPAGGASVTGQLVHMDDFNVTYRDAAGQEHTVARAAGMSVTTKNPLAAHIALLKTITDTQMHDVVAYLETLK